MQATHSVALSVGAGAASDPLKGRMASSIVSAGKQPLTVYQHEGVLLLHALLS